MTNGTSLLKSGKVTLGPRRSTTVKLPLTTDRVAHYLSLGTKDDGIMLKSLRIVP